jgi:hypothetical protein
MLHCSTLGQIRHSSSVSMLSPGACRSSLKWAHLAGESKTVGYSVGLMLIIFEFSVVMSSFDIQYGQA